MMSWEKRRERRGAGMVILRPPEPLIAQQLWHQIHTPTGLKVLRWSPGIEVWRDADGQRWTAETAGEFGFRYIGVADQVPA